MRGVNIVELDKRITDIIYDLMNKEDAKTFKITSDTKLSEVQHKIAGKATADFRCYIEDEYDLIISNCAMEELKTLGDLQRLISD